MRSDFVTDESMAMLTDLYELTMMNAYVLEKRDGLATFDLFVRKLPPERGYLLAAGLEQAVNYLLNLRFSSDDIAYLRKQGRFSEEMLDYLRKFKFTGDLWAVPEGTVIFPNEPILRVTAPIAEAQLFETFLLNVVGFQTLIASKAARIVEAARGRPVIDFSLRRTQGTDAGMKVARATYIAGCVGTSNVLAGKAYGIPIYGTVAHSYVMSFPTELEAFRAWARIYPDNCVLVIDTYDTIQGARNAVTIGKELAKVGKGLAGVRLDSGDPLSLSRKVRKILDDAGLRRTKIFLSGSLNEYVIERLLKVGAPIDSFGVGTSMGVSDDLPALDVNYKLSEVTVRGRLEPTMKLSVEKKTLPGRKQVFRFSRGGMFVKDVIGLQGEHVRGEPLLVKVIENGKLVQRLPPIDRIRARARAQLCSLPAEYKKLKGPKAYPVGLSPGLSTLMRRLERKLMG